MAPQAPEASGPPARVGVYIDFDNVVISAYDRMFGRNAWRSDNARDRSPKAGSTDKVEDRLAEATIDVGALLDYAASFGTVALARAYADWSVPANAAYRRQLVDRAVDLTQLFALGGTKNGADIRLSVDVTADLYQYADLTHVVVVAGDSDYVALAQRCKQLGRFVVGIGVAGSTARALVAACDEFSDYDALPGVRSRPEVVKAPARAKAEPEPEPGVEKDAAEPAKKTARRSRKQAAVVEEPAESPGPDPQSEATALLVRAIRVGLEKSDDEWLHSGGVKSQMQRMDPAFKEKPLGYSSFRAFLESRDEVQVQQTGQQIEVRLTPPD